MLCDAIMTSTEPSSSGISVASMRSSIQSFFGNIRDQILVLEIEFRKSGSGSDFDRLFVRPPDKRSSSHICYEAADPDFGSGVAESLLRASSRLPSSAIRFSACAKRLGPVQKQLLHAFLIGVAGRLNALMVMRHPQKAMACDASRLPALPVCQRHSALRALRACHGVCVRPGQACRGEKTICGNRTASIRTS